MSPDRDIGALAFKGAFSETEEPVAPVALPAERRPT